MNNLTPEEIVVYTVKEVAAMAKTTPYTVRRWIKEGKLPAVIIGNSYRVAERDIVKLLTHGTSETVQ